MQVREQDADSEMKLRALQFKKFALSESDVVIQLLAMSASG